MRPQLLLQTRTHPSNAKNPPNGELGAGTAPNGASYLGERSVGHKDPGATSSALLFTALAGAVADE